MTDVRAPAETLIPLDIMTKPAKRELRVEWSDGHVSVYRYAYLRWRCPGPAGGEDGHQTLEELELLDLELASVNVVKGSCLHLVFEDGHGDCIFSFELLRKICPCGRRH